MDIPNVIIFILFRGITYQARRKQLNIGGGGGRFYLNY